MAAEVGKVLSKNKQITVLKMRVGGIEWLYWECCHVQMYKLYSLRDARPCSGNTLEIFQLSKGFGS